MSAPTNELDALLMGSLQQLSEEFQQREARMNEQYRSCVASFTTQSNALQQEQSALAKGLTEQYKSCVETWTKQSSSIRQEQNALGERLDELTQHYVDTQNVMQQLLQQLDSLNKKLDKR